MAVSNSRVELFADHVEKHTHSPERMAKKYAAVREIADSCGFIAPRVIEVRPASILLERIHGMEPLERLYVSGDHEAFAKAIRRAGQILASLHTRLPTSEGVQWSPPAGVTNAISRYLGKTIDIRSLSQVALHCDYSFTNVCVIAGSPDSIAIIDPCANFGSTFDDWTIAPPYVDVGKMLACLEGQIPFRRQHLRPSSSRVDRLQAAFIEGYEQYGRKLDAEIAHAFAFAVSSAQFYRRFGRLSALHRFALYNRFRGNFPLSRKQGRAG